MNVQSFSAESLALLNARERSEAVVEDDSDSSESADDAGTILDTLNQLLWDTRLGIDREKLEALERGKETVLNDSSLSPEERQPKPLAIQSVIENLLERARQRMVEDEKRKLQISNVERLGELMREKARREE